MAEMEDEVFHGFWGLVITDYLLLIGGDDCGVLLSHCTHVQAVWRCAV
jgi:hypothetical protein